MLKSMFGFLLVAVLIMLSGCFDSEREKVAKVNYSGVTEQFRSNGPALLVDYGFADKYDCYEADEKWLAMNYELLGKVVSKQGGGSIARYADHGCPKFSNFVGCCNDDGRVQCHYLETIYKVEPQKSEQVAWLQRTCREGGGVWESD